MHQHTTSTAQGAACMHTVVCTVHVLIRTPGGSSHTVFNMHPGLSCDGLGGLLKMLLLLGNLFSTSARYHCVSQQCNAPLCLQFTGSRSEPDSCKTSIDTRMKHANPARKCNCYAGSICKSRTKSGG